MASTAPKVTSVEVVPARPTETDSAMIAQLSAEAERSIPETAYIVKIRLAEIPPPTARGWALYVGDTRIPKYWEYQGGIYFKVLDEKFLEEHQREKLRFSENGVDFIDTGVRLPGPDSGRAKRKADVRSLPPQSKVLSDSAPARAGRARAVRKSARTTRAKARKRKRGR
jgi:hypothetical protein